jgi:sulfotransferase family protein
MAQPGRIRHRMKHLLIVSLSRSGGKLLRMLLDGHPQLNVIPFEHWNRRSKNKFPVRQAEGFASLSVEDRLAAAGAAHAKRKLLRLHPQALVAEVMERWRGEITGAGSLGVAYEVLARVYFDVLGRPSDVVVVNHCGSLCRFNRVQLETLYGEGKHLLTIRDPRAVFTSMQGLLYRKFTLDDVRNGRIPASMLERHIDKLETVDAASGYLREFCEDYRKMVAEYAASTGVTRVRFEDLVTSPAATMQQLATELGIRWDSMLLRPTELGVLHRPNSSFARRDNRIHRGAADDWIGRLAPATRDYIERTLAEEMAALGYQPLRGGGRTVLDTAPLLTSN